MYCAYAVCLLLDTLMFYFNSRKTAKHSEDINILEFVFNMHTTVSCSSACIWLMILREWKYFEEVKLILYGVERVETGSNKK